MQLVLFDLLLKEDDSLLVEPVFILKGFHNTISDSVDLFEMLNLAVAVIDKALLF